MVMRRKTSTLPTRIYKYALLPPAEADLVDGAFRGARRYYNALVAIELDRRRRYRELRSAMHPSLARLEEEVRAAEGRLAASRAAVGAAKSAARSRAVAPADRAAVGAVLAELRDLRSRLRAERGRCESPASLQIMRRLRELRKGEQPDLVKKLRDELKEERAKTAFGRAAAQVDAEANEAVKKLRPTLYSGTYLLVEAAVRAASSGAADPRYDDAPDHLARGRIGVHFCGGAGVERLSDSTLMQVSPIPHFRERPSGKLHARGKAARTTLRFRVASTEAGKPVWATFPMVMDRPLPDDARIKDAYVTRQPRDARTPWRYDLCVVAESREFERLVPGLRQEGTTAVNFGWRQLPDGSLRVATASSTERGIQEVRLPARVVSGFAKCSDLQSILAKKFDAAKAELSAWIAGHESELPAEFLESFANVGRWRSQHRLAELVWYWRSHRLPGDEAIYSRLSNPMPRGGDPRSWQHGWLDTYRHLQCWADNERRHLVDLRLDLYRRAVKKICTESASVVVDTFKISDVAARPEAEVVEVGGAAARANRVVAAPSVLRQELLHAAARYHCEVVAAETVNGTRRCNACGEVAGEAVVKLVNRCAACGAAWDQDVNNTDNLADAEAGGEVVSLVTPAEVSGDGEVRASSTDSFGAARRSVRKLLKTG